MLKFFKTKLVKVTNAEDADMHIFTDEDGKKYNVNELAPELEKLLAEELAEHEEGVEQDEIDALHNADEDEDDDSMENADEGEERDEDEDERENADEDDADDKEEAKENADGEFSEEGETTLANEDGEDDADEHLYNVGDERMTAEEVVNRYKQAKRNKKRNSEQRRAANAKAEKEGQAHFDKLNRSVNNGKQVKDNAPVLTTLADRVRVGKDKYGM